MIVFHFTLSYPLQNYFFHFFINQLIFCEKKECIIDLQDEKKGVGENALKMVMMFIQQYFITFNQTFNDGLLSPLHSLKSVHQTGSHAAKIDYSAFLKKNVNLKKSYPSYIFIVI